MPQPIPPALSAIALLTLSNVFMTFAWYAHLKNLAGKPWITAALVSWGIAHAHAHQARLSVGRVVHGRRGLVHVP